MTSDKFYSILKDFQSKLYRLPNMYYAWEDENGRLFMFGIRSGQYGQILKYEYENYLDDYCSIYVDINPNVTHMRGPNIYDPVAELSDKVKFYKYLGSWEDPEHVIPDPHFGGNVLAIGRWDLAKEKILGKDKPDLDEQISGAKEKASVNLSEKSFDFPKDHIR